MRASLIATLIGMLGVTGCGGGGSSVPASGGSGGGGGGTSGSNVQPVMVDSGPAAIANSTSPAVNTLYTTVTVCAPGSTSNCQAIDHIQVDTGSSGLRIISSVLGVTLPMRKDTSGNVIAECVKFVDGSSWGTIRQADIKIAGEVASALSVQVIGDATYQIPSACAGTGKTEDTVAAFGANGILGVGPFIQDCGSSCTVQGGGIYYTCTSSTACADTGMPLAMQVTNPVAAFAVDHQGVIIQLPAVSSTDAGPVNGSLIFGIGTQTNNGLGSAQVLTLNANGELGTNYKASQLTRSVIDSGSNAFYFPDASINVCGQSTAAPGFYCPLSGTLALTATMVGVNGTSAAIDFSVANADSLFKSGARIAAAVALAGSSAGLAPPTAGSTFDGSNTFDWGLPFYFGRTVYTVIENENTTGGGVGPYFAF